MNKFCSLVGFASDAALAIGGDMQVVAWNERAKNLLGYEPKQALGQPCYEILQAILPSGEPLCTPECEGKSCFLHHSPFTVHECSLRHKDGGWLRASISSMVTPAHSKNNAAGSPLAIILLRAKDDAVSSSSTDARLRILTFGSFSLSAANRGLPIERWHRKQALTLLKVLVTHRGEALHREQLIEHLWPDANERRGRERLKVTTCFLRQQMCAAGARGDIVTVANATYALRREAVWLDCEVFESLFNEGRLLERRGQLKEALVCFEKAERIYKGDYLPEDRYAEWCAEERERLREVYFDVLGRLVDGYLESGDHDRAAQVCRLALVREPYRESFHRKLMVCLLRLGRCDCAIAHYQRCRQLLKSELNVEPAPETERLYRELVVAGKTRSAAPRVR